MRGQWYGVGVGPGDPELMTLKAVRILKECGCIAIPGRDRESCVAYNIAVQSVPEIADKPYICLAMPMTKDVKKLEESHREAVCRTKEWLDRGENVAFITLGDSSVYSTCLYVMERLQQEAYKTSLINGITSFCAAAARLELPLVNGSEELHIIPASYQIEEALALPGVKVLMKAGREISSVKKLLSERNCRVKMVENCGMEQEHVYQSLSEIPDDAGYFSLFIVRDALE